MNIEKVLRAPFSQNISGRMLLRKVMQKKSKAKQNNVTKETEDEWAKAPKIQKQMKFFISKLLLPDLGSFPLR